MGYNPVVAQYLKEASTRGPSVGFQGMGILGVAGLSAGTVIGFLCSLRMTL